MAVRRRCFLLSAARFGVEVDPKKKMIVKNARYTYINTEVGIIHIGSDKHLAKNSP